MNQQRSRRFKAAKEADEKERKIEEIQAKGRHVVRQNSFDSNCISPVNFVVGHSMADILNVSYVNLYLLIALGNTFHATFDRGPRQLCAKSRS